MTELRTIDPIVLKRANPRLYADLAESIIENMAGRSPAMSVDDHIRALSPAECLDKFLEWNGIVGWTKTIVAAVHAIEEAY